MSNPSMRRDWRPASPVSDRVWAQAVHAVVERRLTLRQSAQAFGLQQAALHRLVRQHTLQQLRRPASTRSLPGSLPSAASPTNSDNSHFTTPVPSTGNDRYVFPRLNPLALGHGSPNNKGSSSNAPLPGVAAAVMPSPPMCELTPELNDEIVVVLQEQFMQQQQYNDYETTDGRYNRLEGYADADIADVVRSIVGHNGRRALPSNFPSAGWLTMFKRENDFVDVDDVVRSRGRTSSSSNNNNNLKNGLSSQQLQQERYNRSYEFEQQQFEIEAQRRGDQVRWIENRNYRQPAAPPPPSPLQRSPIQRHASYSWKEVDGTESAGSSVPQQRVRFYQPQRQSRDENNFRRSPSAGSSNSKTVHSDSGNASDRNYRQSNLVPAKVWEAAMEDVAIHGMSLRNAAKAHGVHFAALHRRLKKRQQHKLNVPCEPNYIPFEDEAGVVRVIHARAEMGVLLTFTELVDLLKRTALKHRSELPEEIAIALVRRFQSRVEQSVRHLIIDWPSVSSNVLYQLREGDGKDGMTAEAPTPASIGKTNVPSVVSGSSGSLSSSGSSSSLSPHPQSAAVFPGMRKSPVDAGPTSTRGKNSSNSRTTDSNVEAGENSKNVDSANASAATVSPDDNETAPAQPCMILRL
uniref:HTH psq-type domain-containing protein n=1 Tax=Phytophthora ramorum TaxID=164328 RepID=H3GG64_PHYRM